MAHLKLVAGTAVTGQHLPMKEAPTAAGVSVSELKEHARAAIRKLKLGIEGLTVSEMLDEINHNRAGETMPLVTAVRRNSALSRVLRSAGLHPNPAQPEQELDVHVYGVVLDSKALVKACPALKPYGTVLDGLAL